MGKKELVKLGHDGKGFTLDGERLLYVTKFEYKTDVEEGLYKGHLKLGVIETGEENGKKTVNNVEYDLEVDDSELYKSEIEYTTIDK